MILIQNSVGLLDRNKSFHVLGHEVLTSLPRENIVLSSVKNMNNKFYVIAKSQNIFTNSVFFFKLVKPSWRWIIFDCKTAPYI